MSAQNTSDSSQRQEGFDGERLEISTVGGNLMEA